MARLRSVAWSLGVSEAAVGTLDALIAATQRATGVSRAHLAIVGYSRGGGVALLHAARTGSTLPIVDIAGMVTGQVSGFGGGPLPTDEAAMKLLYLATRNARKTWGRAHRDWLTARMQIAIHFPGRLG